MDIPEKLKIGGHLYEVKYPYHFEERGDINGQHDFDALCIRLDKNDGYSHLEMPESRIAANFLHEILHACDGITGHRVFRDNEPAIEGIAETLFQVLRDNHLHFDEID
jgi:hypothetical protein